MTYRYHTLDVFTDRPGGGNRLAVFPRADGLSPERMQDIARGLGYSESAFVLPPTNAAAAHRVRIFTPGMELPFAGHPTLGTAHLLAALGLVPLERGTGADGVSETRTVLEEAVGLVPVTIRLVDGRPVFARLTAVGRAEERPAPPAAAIARLLSLDAGDLRDDAWSPTAASAGVPFLVVPVRDVATLGRARLDRTEWERLLAGAWAPHVYVVAEEEPGATLRARMFAPAMHIEEDPATGAAAAALAGYIARRAPGGPTSIRRTIRQGIEMGRPSTIEIEADVAGGAVAAVRVGGASVVVGGGEVMESDPTVPPDRAAAHI